MHIKKGKSPVHFTKNNTKNGFQGKKMKQKGYEDGRVSTEWYENGIQINKQIRAWLGVKWR